MFSSCGQRAVHEEERAVDERRRDACQVSPTHGADERVRVCAWLDSLALDGRVSEMKRTNEHWSSLTSLPSISNFSGNSGQSEMRTFGRAEEKRFDGNVIFFRIMRNEGIRWIGEIGKDDKG